MYPGSRISTLVLQVRKSNYPTETSYLDLIQCIRHPVSESALQHPRQIQTPTKYVRIPKTRSSSSPTRRLRLPRPPCNTPFADKRSCNPHLPDFLLFSLRRSVRTRTTQFPHNPLPPRSDVRVFVAELGRRGRLLFRFRFGKGVVVGAVGPHQCRRESGLCFF